MIKIDKTPNGKYRALDTKKPTTSYGLELRAWGSTEKEARKNLSKVTKEMV